MLNCLFQSAPASPTRRLCRWRRWWRACCGCFSLGSFHCWELLHRCWSSPRTPPQCPCHCPPPSPSSWWVRSSHCQSIALVIVKQNLPPCILELFKILFIINAIQCKAENQRLAAVSQQIKLYDKLKINENLCLSKKHRKKCKLDTRSRWLLLLDLMVLAIPSASLGDPVICELEPDWQRALKTSRLHWSSSSLDFVKFRQTLAFSFLCPNCGLEAVNRLSFGLCSTP